MEKEDTTHAGAQAEAEEGKNDCYFDGLDSVVFLEVIFLASENRRFLLAVFIHIAAILSPHETLKPPFSPLLTPLFHRIFSKFTELL